jgi:Flp pilus assembly protein TadD
LRLGSVAASARHRMGHDMGGVSQKSFRALMMAGLAAVALAGCSSLAGVGNSTFGANKLAVAEISDIGDYTADRALSEGRAHFRNNDFGYSATLYKRVVDLSPKDPQGYVGLGASYDRLGRFDLSDRVYASLFSLSGGTVQYYNNVGYSYMLRGNLTAALSNFRKASKLEPDNVVVANNLQILANAAASARA